ncbi:AAA family ATPase [Microbacterium aquilitoris]|uniref:AAA family ATPase n=1 Tax=Microbacterium aquilitoris TaxID=3067307 RepID=UPI000E23C6B9|nr:AAA family ATPase [Microbacterium sp. KSW2-22]MDT3345895.1 AAA family ATPase [Microbacterium sp. KSW2-22]
MSDTRFRHGVVVGKFYPLHAGHAHLIRSAARQCERVTVEVIAASVESIPLAQRAAWIREEHPTVRVVDHLDDTPVDFASDTAWEAHTATIAGLLDSPADAVFTSDAYGEELARRLGATWVQVDPGRVHNPVSGTAIRADIAAHWHELAPAARASLAARIVVLGAESTGSTTLAAALAEELGTTWVPEYGREYSEIRDGGLDAPWRSDEFDLVVDRQMAMEDAALRRVRTPVLVCDTDVLATALWHERYVGRPAPGIRRRAEGHRPALYVLTGDEIPFVQDGMRDGEHIRHAMQRRFREVLAEQSAPWLEVRGSVAERVAAVLPAAREAIARATSFAAPLEGRPLAEQEALRGRTTGDASR